MKLAEIWFKDKKFKKALTKDNLIEAYTAGFRESNNLMGKVVDKIVFPEAKFDKLTKRLASDAFKSMNSKDRKLLGVDRESNFYLPDDKIVFYSGGDVIAVIDLDENIEKKFKG